MAPHHVREVDTALGQVFFAPTGSAALCDFYTHPVARGRGLFFKAICQLLHDVPATGARQAFIDVYADNGPSRHVIEKVGFRHVGNLIHQARLSAQQALRRLRGRRVRPRIPAPKDGRPRRNLPTRCCGDCRRELPPGASPRWGDRSCAEVR